MDDHRSSFSDTADWSGRRWRITVGDLINVVGPKQSIELPCTSADELKVRRGLLGWRLKHSGRRLCRLRGMTGAEALALRIALASATFRPAVAEVVRWHTDVTNAASEAFCEQRWIPSETTSRLASTRPPRGLLQVLRSQVAGSALSSEELTALTFLDEDLGVFIAGVNEQILASELETRRQFFNTIEKTPLSQEQAEAVVCFDNRVQLLAAAGSGKTSVMIARAAYAVSRGFVTPDRILMLAFNRAAADELQQRVEQRFKVASIDSRGVRASTFHSFGLDLIGRFEGERPRLARWLDQGSDLDTVLEIVDELRDASADFRYKWDLYRTVFAKTPTDLDAGQPDGWDKEKRASGYDTCRGEVVKSHGERMIADFMFFNGVDYDYERSYVHRTASTHHAQYHPDFYYPDVDVWHEHWALDAAGQPPAKFPGYREGMQWKRDIHAQYGTTLVESTWAEVIFKDGLAKLQHDLESHGVTFDWNPDRTIPNKWVRPFRHEDLARLVRTFMTHVKSNGLSLDDLQQRLAATPASDGSYGYRSQLFLDIYWPIHAEWERRLRSEQCVDFEDMLVRAAGLLEQGLASSDYDLILVDEFQDASQARARLVRGLVRQPGKYLLAVGDDWQAINRFAGADISVMRDFERWFGTTQQRALTVTFRCPQTVCDVATRFITANPSQLVKPMNSIDIEPGSPVLVVEGDDTAKVVECLDEIVEEVGDGRATVFVLGRYNFQREVLPKRKYDNLSVAFRTVHGSKGLEADYVIVVGLDTSTYGFPSAITDDPVLSLAMPAPEGFEHAEERRLFYVALTRARRKAILIAPPRGISPFLVEVLEHESVESRALGAHSLVPCPRCRKGTLVRRDGRHGPFFGCSGFPACANTQSLAEVLGIVTPSTGDLRSDPYQF